MYVNYSYGVVLHKLVQLANVSLNHNLKAQLNQREAEHTSIFEPELRRRSCIELNRTYFLTYGHLFVLVQVYHLNLDSSDGRVADQSKRSSNKLNQAQPSSNKHVNGE